MSAVIRCKLLIVGGGTAGCSLAAKFSRILPKKDVILIDAAKNHYYQPMFTLIGGGLKNFKKSFKPMSTIVPKNVTWVEDFVTNFYPEEGTVKTKTGREISYDMLVIALGIEPDYDKITGLKSALDKRGNGVCTIYSPYYVEKTFEEIEYFEGGNMIFTQPSTPIKCAGAPQKIMHLAEEFIRKAHKENKTDISFITGLPNLFSVPKYEKALEKLASEKNIKTIFNTEILSVDTKCREITVKTIRIPDHTTKIKYDFLHVVPPYHTPEALRCNKELTDKDGYLSVNKGTLQHDKYKNIFGIGDCANLPTSKTAAAVAAQTKVVFQNISQILDGKATDLEKYNGYTSCPLVTGLRKCILAEFDYDREPLETFPFDQVHESMLMYWMKAHILPIMYWKMMLKGYWHGPAFLRKILHFGKEPRRV